MHLWAYKCLYIFSKKELVKILPVKKRKQVSPFSMCVSCTTLCTTLCDDIGKVSNTAKLTNKAKICKKYYVRTSFTFYTIEPPESFSLTL